MKPVSQLTLTQLVALGDLATQNALDAPEILDALTPYGFGADALTAGRTMLGTLQTNMQRQTDLYGQQMEATRTLDMDWKTFRDTTYGTHTGLARLAFKKETGTRRRLGLSVRGKSSSFRAWAERAQQFYTTALNDEPIRTTLAARNVSEEALTSGRAEVDRLIGLDRRQEDLKGQAQQATRDKDAAEATLRKWLGEFRDTARIALKDRPDWLERLGFNEPS